MNHETERARLLHRLDDLVAEGELPPELAKQLRTSDDPAITEAALRHIRNAHARKRVDHAVQAGRLDDTEAAAILHRLAAGDDPMSIPGMRSGFRNRREPQPGGHDETRSPGL